MSWKLFLDDNRDPKTKDFTLARSYKSAVKLVQRKGCPIYIAFDYDLGEDESGLNFANWLIQKDELHYGKFLPEGFGFECHSTDTEGKVSIEKVMSEYLSSKRNR